MNSYREKDRELTRFVAERVSLLQARYLRDDARAVAALARLRRGVATRAGSMPELWELTFDNMPTMLADESDFSRSERDGAPTKWEQAAHDAITLHAWHQQSRSEPMHRNRAGFGTALRTLGDRISPEGVRRRFHALGTTSQHDARLIMLRGLVGQLRAHSIPLDYGRLACDLRRLDGGTYAKDVLLQWGRDYHRAPARDTNDPQTTPVKGEI
ncbi:type I-E CRISPR-associated protein Cse2/CasB [Nocardia tengchongensis]|uniref:type I-E CRISPR-associated protein Cse2/CasB n=1 Tax=Nocardia tengchongensis TaxID=2055889 RepID=UPI0036A0DD2B